MYRIASDLAPYVTHPGMPWFHTQIDECSAELAVVGEMAATQGLRLSFHPSQSNVLNAIDEVVARNSAAQITAHARLLDTMDLERERGITIKAQAIRMEHQGYILNLIDTPGHVDFSYEVSRSLAACEGALLLIDASQGIEAQTLANAHLALQNNLTIIPIINKIDLPIAEPEKVLIELKNVFGINKEDVILASAKEGIGVPEILKAIIDKIPAPKGSKDEPLRALIFDSHYDVYRGVIAYIRVVNGTLKTGAKIMMMGAQNEYEALEIGTLKLGLHPKDSLIAGEVGYLIAGVKNVRECRVGDTITDAKNPAETPLPGYQPIKPMVFCGFYPINPGDFEHLKDALEKLQLNDAALSFETETSAALGFGFRCTISRCRSPKNPQRKPKPRAAEVSVSKLKAASFN